MTFEVIERSTAVYTATLKDETDTVIPSASLTTLTLTLYDAANGTIINSRNGQNVLNANNVTIHATSGLLTWTMQPADNVIVWPKASGQFEKHIALFRWTWSSGAKAGSHEVEIRVRQRTKIAD